MTTPNDPNEQGDENIQDVDVAVAPLIARLDDPDEQIRYSAIHALVRLGTLMRSSP